MVDTRSSNKRGWPEDSTAEDQAEAKRLRIETIDGQQAGASANSSGAAAAAAAAIEEVAKSDDIGAGEGPGQGPPAGVNVPVAADDTGTVNDASGDGGGSAAAGLDDEMQRAEAGLCLLRQEFPGDVTSFWNRLFWKRGAFTRARLVGEAAAAAAAREAAAAEVEAAAEAAAAAAAAAAEAEAAAAGPGTVRAKTFAGATEATRAGWEQGVVHADADADADADGGMEISKEVEKFLQEQRAVWEEFAEQVRRDRAAFRASVEGPGAAAHVKLMEDMGAAGASEEEVLAAKEALDSRIQEWQKGQFAAACGGQAFAEGVQGASGTERGDAPSTPGAGTGTRGIGPLGELFGTPIGRNGSSNDASSSGSTDGELSDMSPQKAHQPSPSPSPSPLSDDHAGQGKGKGKGKKRRRDDDDDDDDEDDGSEGHGAKRARQK